MRELFDDIVEKISDAAEQVGKKTDEMIETQKIKSKIRGLEKYNRRDFRDLGRMIYEKYRAGEVLDGEYLTLCKAVAEREEEIQDYEKELVRVKED